MNEQKKFRVHLYNGHEMPYIIKETTDIDEARRWVANSEHGHIYNWNNILVQ
jgi:hypothetical protein|tara:strand:- start:341 stop:496 length:156 start_codon:yes stop_codon:yes gene_type:complete